MAQAATGSRDGGELVGVQVREDDAEKLVRQGGEGWHGENGIGNVGVLFGRLVLLCAVIIVICVLWWPAIFVLEIAL